MRTVDGAMPDGETVRLAERFEVERPRLRAVAVRILGSGSDVDDVVQEAWLRLQHIDAGEIDNLPAWLTTVVGRLSLNALRARKRRRIDETPDQELAQRPGDEAAPEAEALLADAVAVALVVVLDTLAPAERVAFVLHDIFDVPFDDIAELLGRSTGAVRQLASRARRRIAQPLTVPEPSRHASRQVVDAFFAAGRGGQLDRLLAVLHPDVVLNVDTDLTRSPQRVAGAHTVATRARSFASPDLVVTPITFAGVAGALITRAQQRVSLMLFTVEGDVIVAIDVLVGAQRLDRLRVRSPHAEPDGTTPAD